MQPTDLCYVDIPCTAPKKQELAAANSYGAKVSESVFHLEQPHNHSFPSGASK